MKPKQSHSTLVYAATVVLSLALHSMFFLIPAEVHALGPKLAAQQGRTSVDISFMPSRREKPPAEEPRHLRKPPEKPSISKPALTRPTVDIADIVEKPPAPEETGPAPPAEEDMPRAIRQPVAPEDHPFDIQSTADDVGARAPLLAPDNGKPEYPRACRMGLHRRNRVPCEGTAAFLVRVGIDGYAKEITLLESAGCSHLDESAHRWLEKARFLPATKHGKPVEGTKMFRVTFTMEDSDPLVR
ncbi:MAG: energy transducer TonB [Planctomycetes bacterium]|nr:energy transducer TonB [Planctomycetota bacterium]